MLHPFRVVFLALLFFATANADQPELRTQSLVASPPFDSAVAEKTIVDRILAGALDGTMVDLCVDDPVVCESEMFRPYRIEIDGEVDYTLELTRDAWAGLPPEVQQAVIRAFLYWVWGHPQRDWSPLEVFVAGSGNASPLDRLSPPIRGLYLRFADPRDLVGGVAGDAYAPNCWYTAIAAISDKGSEYARSRDLMPASWDAHRFMGPTEFRFHMREFEEVETPEFGDIIRYYTEDVIREWLVWGGEIHAAVYVGREPYLDNDGRKQWREIALTKNGRSDLDFCIFQDVQGMDDLYMGHLPEDHALLKRFGGKDPRRKAYFRVKSGGSVLDPRTVGVVSDAYAAYLVDRFNYRNRWACLAEKIGPPPGNGTNCYGYPADWLAIRRVD